MIINLFLSALLVPSALLITYRFFSFEFWLNVFNALAPDRDAAGFTKALHANLSSNFLVIGLILLILTIFGFIYRERVDRWISSIPPEWRIFCQDISANLQHKFWRIPWPSQVALLVIIVIGAGLRLWHINTPLDFISETAFVDLSCDRSSGHENINSDIRN